MWVKRKDMERDGMGWDGTHAQQWQERFTLEP